MIAAPSPWRRLLPWRRSTISCIALCSIVAVLSAATACGGQGVADGPRLDALRTTGTPQLPAGAQESGRDSTPTAGVVDPVPTAASATAPGSAPAATVQSASPRPRLTATTVPQVVADAETAASPTTTPAPARTPAGPTARPATPAPSPAAAPVVRYTVRSWIEKPGDFEEGRFTDAQVSAGEGVRLAPSGDGFASSGEYLSTVQQADFPFDNAVLSWNADAPTGTTVRLELRVQGASSWSGWYTMGEWRADGGRSVAGQQDARGRVDVDTLKLNSPATALQYRARLSTTSPGASPMVRQVAVVYSDLRSGLAGPPVPKPAGATRDLEVPRESQLQENPSIALKICSPTSLAMVMQYWGVKKTVAEVAEAVRDRSTGIYGNWPLNTAFAAANGFEARVDRFYSIEQLEQEIAAGRPVMVSIAYNAGELPGAASSAAPQGHLIVVRGFTPDGDVIVNDPAAPTDQAVRLVYSRENLGRIWQRSGGVVYLVAPRGS